MHNEGGMFSAQREYLRMRRERLVFDICFAQFGAYWFCSRRYSEIPVVMRVWELLVVLAVFAGVEWFFANTFGMVLGSSLFGASLLGIGFLMHNLVSMGLHDLDAALIQVPVIGGIYEFFFRKETYYREDTRSAYVSIVDAITKEKLDALTNAHDAKLVAYLDATPPSHPTVMRLIGDLLRLRK